MYQSNIAVCADGNVGIEVINFLWLNFPEHLKVVIVVNEKSEVFHFLKKIKYPDNRIILNSHVYNEESIKLLRELKLDYIILAWWPYIVKKVFYSLPKMGTINFHPSYLPFNRGKNYNFWTLVEETQFGVSIHFVDDSIDGGDIIFQSKIHKTWEDNGETLYFKAQESIIKMFIDNYHLLITGEYKRIKQNSKEGTFHYSNELEPASEIFLEKQYKGRDILNLLRARTFRGYPGCYFYDSDRKYEVRIEIKEIK